MNLDFLIFLINFSWSVVLFPFIHTIQYIKKRKKILIALLTTSFIFNPLEKSHPFNFWHTFQNIFQEMVQVLRQFFPLHLTSETGDLSESSQRRLDHHYRDKKKKNFSIRGAAIRTCKWLASHSISVSFFKAQAYSCLSVILFSSFVDFIYHYHYLNPLRLPIPMLQDGRYRKKYHSGICILPLKSKMYSCNGKKVVRHQKWRTLL